MSKFEIVMNPRELAVYLQGDMKDFFIYKLAVFLPQDYDNPFVMQVQRVIDLMFVA